MSEETTSASPPSGGNVPEGSLANTSQASMEAQAYADLGLGADGSPTAAVPAASPVAPAAPASRTRDASGRFTGSGVEGEATTADATATDEPSAPDHGFSLEEDGSLKIGDERLTPDELRARLGVASDPMSVRSEAYETLARAKGEREQAQAALKQIVEYQNRMGGAQPQAGQPAAPAQPAPTQSTGFEVPEDFDYTDPKAIIELMGKVSGQQISHHMGEVKRGIEEQNSARQKNQLEARAQQVNNAILSTVQSQISGNETLKQMGENAGVLIMNALNAEINAGKLGIRSTDEQIKTRVETHAQELASGMDSMLREMVNARVNGLASAQAEASHLVSPPAASGMAQPGAKVSDDYNPGTLMDPNAMAADAMRSLEFLSQSSRS